MSHHIKGKSRSQATLFPEVLDDFVSTENPVRVIDVFVDELDLNEMGFKGVVPKDTGRSNYHPAVLLKLYLYGYLNRIQSSRWLEREANRNIELMWLTERLAPDFKTIADFRKITVKVSSKVAEPLSVYVASLICLVMQLLLLMVANSKPQTTNQKITHLKNCKIQWRELKNILTDTLINWIRST
tara:strand:- start:961 stop:1515 length:555 start_codon:yes stop_codon:yes gene_type:complete